jgi:hypothetical protein
MEVPMKRVWTEADKVTGVCYILEIEPEHIPYKGNCSAVDPETDRKAEEWIRRQLARGNLWAWCCVKVTASLGDQEGVDYLGGCSYKNVDQFIQPGGYWDDMKREALRNMNQ